MFKRSLVAAALLGLSAGMAQAAANPTAVITQPGFTFADWLGVNNAPVGAGQVDDDDTLYFIKEYGTGDFQSWMIFFDPKGRGSIDAVITFDRPVIGINVTDTDVANTTPFGLISGNGVTYLNVNNTGLEPLTDSATFAGNTVTIRWTATDPGDHIRVFTAVPEPSSVALVALGLLGVGASLRRSRRG
ncbi:MAG: PEP-CTERM sorting domain-containing protein [Burkholderiales bacterium]|jgi:hypothetical protein|nr:PEP-CTERM sorting domain-containing protein [Burkholderiales bacterium]